MKTTLWIHAVPAALVLSGCSTTYHLPGHSEANKLSPPAITMTQGKSRKILTSGVERFGLALPPALYVRTSDPSVVAVRGSSWTASLVAVHPGTARVYYDPSTTSPENRGFEVTVLPTKH